MAKHISQEDNGIESIIEVSIKDLSWTKDKSQVKMKKRIPDYILQALRDLEKAVSRDSYDLTRDDQDAICTRISELRHFIQNTYDGHKQRNFDE